MTQPVPEKYAVLVNLAANDGRAARRWESIEAALRQQLPPDTYFHCFRPPTDLEPLVRELLAQGVRAFISAGGDGSANHLLQLLMRLHDEHAGRLWLGGIGLGSSNDFIKPKQHFLGKIPVRLNAADAQPVDVGKAEYETESGEWQTRYFIANASMGVTAEANWFFNHGDALIRFLKKRWTDGAILYAALRTIFLYRNISVQLSAENLERQIQLSNLAVLKSPYVSGSFCYDDPVARDDGFLGINISMDMSAGSLIRVLYGLSRGRFRGQPNTMSFPSAGLQLQSEQAAALELDGEVDLCRQVRFTICPGAIRLMAL